MDDDDDASTGLEKRQIASVTYSHRVVFFFGRSRAGRACLMFDLHLNGCCPTLGHNIPLMLEWV